jgi:hypothetical protein
VVPCILAPAPPPAATAGAVGAALWAMDNTSTDER